MSLGLLSVKQSDVFKITHTQIFLAKQDKIIYFFFSEHLSLKTNLFHINFEYHYEYYGFLKELKALWSADKYMIMQIV